MPSSRWSCAATREHADRATRVPPTAPLLEHARCSGAHRCRMSARCALLCCALLLVWAVGIPYRTRPCLGDQAPAPTPGPKPIETNAWLCCMVRLGAYHNQPSPPWASSARPALGCVVTGHQVARQKQAAVQIRCTHYEHSWSLLLCCCVSSFASLKSTLCTHGCQGSAMPASLWVAD